MDFINLLIRKKLLENMKGFAASASNGMHLTSDNDSDFRLISQI